MKKPQPTRTLNPLPFQDLEPHRFEDLVRALAWDFRRWQSLEAIGRAGSDEGIDIRAVELVRHGIDDESRAPEDGELDEDEEDDDDEQRPFSPAVVREWIIQCKREKAFAPADVKKAIAESLDSKPVPHGFVLAVACDLSKKARDAFRTEMVKRGVQEFHTWARGELEDQLFQAKNDRVLFAFFGISLNTRRQGAATKLRSEISIKRRLRAAIIKDGETDLVLLRDPTDDRYPNECDDARWLLCKFEDTKEPAGMCVLARERIAWVRSDGAWDTVDDYLPSRLFRLEEMGMRDFEFGQEPIALQQERARARTEPAREFWETYVPEAERAYLKLVEVVPYSQVLAIDAIGDGYYPVPHVFVEWTGERGPFTGDQWAWFARSRGEMLDITPKHETRTKLFPVPIPPVYPPPPGFEYSPQITTLSTETTAALSAILKRAAATLAEPATQPTATETHEPSSPNDFRQWREEVAGPVLRAFVDRLRAAGHEARLASRSVAPAPALGSWEEELEFHVTLMARTIRHSPEYRPTGSLKFSADSFNAFHFTVKPGVEQKSPPPDRYGRHVEPPPPAQPTLQEFTAERVAAETVAMIERLFEPRY